MTDTRIVIDTSALSNLAKGGGLDSLLIGDSRIILTNVVSYEVAADSPVRLAIASWLAANAARIDVIPVDMTQSPRFANDTTNLGEKSIIEYIRTNPLPEGSRILIDDRFIQNFESYQLPPALRGVLPGATGRAQTSIEFLNESLLNGRLGPQEYSRIADGMKQFLLEQDLANGRPAGTSLNFLDANKFWTYEEATARWADWRFYSGIDFERLQADMSWVVTHTGIDGSPLLTTSFKVISVSGGIFLVVDAGATTLRIANYANDNNIYAVGAESLGFAGRVLGSFYGGTYGAMLAGGGCLAATGGAGSFGCGVVALVGLLGGAYYGAKYGDAAVTGVFNATLDAMQEFGGIRPAQAGESGLLSILPALFPDGTTSIELLDESININPFSTTSLRFENGLTSDTYSVIATYANGWRRETQYDSGDIDASPTSQTQYYDPFGDLVSREVYLNDGTSIIEQGQGTQDSGAFDGELPGLSNENDDPIGDPTSGWETTVRRPSRQTASADPEQPAIITGSQVGSIFGSSLGQLVGGSNVFARVAAGSALSAVLGNVGETFDRYFNDTTGNLSLSDAADQAFSNIDTDFGGALRSAGIGAAASFLTAELAESFGINTDSFGGRWMRAYVQCVDADGAANDNAKPDDEQAASAA